MCYRLVVRVTANTPDDCIGCSRPARPERGHAASRHAVPAQPLTVLGISTGRRSVSRGLRRGSAVQAAGATLTSNVMVSASVS